MKFINWFIVIFVSYFFKEAFSILEEIQQPIEMTMKKITKCSDMGKDSIPFSHTMTKSDDGRNKIAFNFTLPFDINNDYTMSMVIMNKGANGKWAKMIEKTVKICEMEKMTAMMKMPERMQKAVKCPIKKGVYEISDIPDTMTFSPTLMLPLGDYRVESSLYKVNQDVKESCHASYISIKKGHA